MEPFFVGLGGTHSLDSFIYYFPGHILLSLISEANQVFKKRESFRCSFYLRLVSFGLGSGGGFGSLFVGLGNLL